MGENEGDVPVVVSCARGVAVATATVSQRRKSLGDRAAWERDSVGRGLVWRVGLPYSSVMAEAWTSRTRSLDQREWRHLWAPG